jgi:type IV fimbrial biogenesis protein FimT
MKSTQHGLSMIELIAGIGIVGILLAIGVPSYRYITNSNRVSSEVNGLLWDLQFARSEAIKEGRTVTICPSTAALKCAGTGTWHRGWIVFTDVNNSAQVDSNSDTVLRNQPAFGNSDTFVSDNGIQSVTFNREGFAAGLAAPAAGFVTVTLHDSTANAQWTRCLEISTIGRLRTERYGDTKGNCQ